MKNPHVTVRNYNPETDYSGVLALYAHSATFGGQYDAARDTAEKLRALSAQNPNKILVATIKEKIVGTVTLFEDGRSAWLYRFAVQSEHEDAIANVLYTQAVSILKSLGHTQVLVYAPSGDTHFTKRYTTLGLKKGSDYTAFWKDI
jgi:hypothetical protein